MQIKLWKDNERLLKEIVSERRKDILDYSSSMTTVANAMITAAVEMAIVGRRKIRKKK